MYSSLATIFFYLTGISIMGKGHKVKQRRPIDIVRLYMEKKASDFISTTRAVFIG